MWKGTLHIQGANEERVREGEMEYVWNKVWKGTLHIHGAGGEGVRERERWNM